MPPKDLEQRLMEMDSSRAKRQEVISWILRDKPHYVRETLQWCFNNESDLLVKSCWILEGICDRRPRVF